MKVPHLVVNTGFLGMSGYMVRESLQLDFYTSSGPGPGLLPFWVAVIMGGLALLGLYRAALGPASPLPEGFIPSRTGMLRICAIILAVIGTIVLMRPLGFRITMLMFLVFLLSVLGRQKPIVTVLVAFAGSFGVFYLFTSWLRVSLPIGALGL